MSDDRDYDDWRANDERAQRREEIWEDRERQRRRYEDEQRSKRRKPKVSTKTKQPPKKGGIFSITNLVIVIVTIYFISQCSS